MVRGRSAVLTALLGVTVLAVVGGCQGRVANADKGLGSPPSPVVQPASQAGGACQLLDYVEIEATLGARFAVAAASRQDETYTCVVQAPELSYPDLMLAVTATVADRAAFDAAVRPADALPVDGLGLAGYTVAVPAAGASGPGSAGPGTTVGWLTGNGRLIQLTYRLSPRASAAQAAETTPRLVALAKKIDFASS